MAIATMEERALSSQRASSAVTALTAACDPLKSLHHRLYHYQFPSSCRRPHQASWPAPIPPRRHCLLSRLGGMARVIVSMIAGTPPMVIAMMAELGLSMHCVALALTVQTAAADSLHHQVPQRCVAIIVSTPPMVIATMEELGPSTPFATSDPTVGTAVPPLKLWSHQLRHRPHRPYPSYPQTLWQFASTCAITHTMAIAMMEERVPSSQCASLAATVGTAVRAHQEEMGVAAAMTMADWAPSTSLALLHRPWL